MKKKLIILGSGSSVGTPRIDGFWGKCKKGNEKNIRTRCSAIIIKGNNTVLIDTSPDIKKQFLDNKIKKISSVIFTHEHADQTNGLFELRPFYWKTGKKIKIYATRNTLTHLKSSNRYLFKKVANYPPIIKASLVRKNFTIGSDKNKINFKAISVKHGKIISIAYIFEKIAYISDCNDLSITKNKNFKNLNCIVLDCLKFKKHPNHFNYDECLYIYKKLIPRKMVLTNLHYDLDYKKLLKILPKNIVPAYDGLKIYL